MTLDSVCKTTKMTGDNIENIPGKEDPVADDEDSETLVNLKSLRKQSNKTEDDDDAYGDEDDEDAEDGEDEDDQITMVNYFDWLVVNDWLTEEKPDSGQPEYAVRINLLNQ